MNKKEKKEYSNQTHNQIIGWTENCDTKASILIAFIGVFVSIFFTSDYILSTLQNLIKTVFSYWRDEVGGFDLLFFFTFLFLAVTLFFIGWAIILLFDVVAGKTKCNEDSIIFFGKIHDKSLTEYLESVDTVTDDDLLKDRLQQIHNCSKRCAEKFANYNKATKKVKWGLLFLCIFMVCILAVNSL